MRTTRYYKYLAAWLILLCFVVGQVVVFAHQHHALKYSVYHTSDMADMHKQDITEKCKLCDVMHHFNAVHEQYTYAVNLPQVTFFFPSVTDDFKSFGLILADGLSPPAIIIA